MVNFLSPAGALSPLLAGAAAGAQETSKVVPTAAAPTECKNWRRLIVCGIVSPPSTLSRFNWLCVLTLLYDFVAKSQPSRKRDLPQ
jgi:hypothetical protein